MSMAELGPIAWVRAQGARRVLWVVRAIPALGHRLASTRRQEADGRVLDRDTAVVLAIDELVNGPPAKDVAVDVARARLLEEVRSVDGPPAGGVEVDEREVQGEGTVLRGRLYAPEGLAAPSPGIAFLHGGGWVVGDLDSHDTLCRRLARDARCRVLSIDYRLAPEHRFPTPVRDAVAAVRWVLAHAEELGMAPERIAVAGDSAGGNLSAVVARHLRRDERKPALQVLIYPATDATRSLPSHQSVGQGYFLDEDAINWYLDHYRDESVDDRDPDLSPLWAADVTGVAPAVIVTAGFDPLRDEGEAYRKKLEDAGVAVVYREHPSLIHGFTLMTEAVPAARRATEELAGDIARLLRT